MIYSSGLSPIAVFLDEVNQPLDGCGLGDVHLDALLALVQADAAGSRSDVAVVGVGHLARTVDDTSHDADFQVGQVGCRLLDALYRRLQVKHRPAAAGARDKFGLADAQAGRLQDGVGQSGEG